MFKSILLAVATLAVTAALPMTDANAWGHNSGYRAPSAHSYGHGGYSAHRPSYGHSTHSYRPSHSYGHRQQYVAPHYVAPRYVAPTYAAPTYYARPQYVAPSYVQPTVKYHGVRPAYGHNQTPTFVKPHAAPQKVAAAPEPAPLPETPAIEPAPQPETPAIEPK